MAQTINLDTSQRVDITCRKGDTFELVLTLTTDSGDSAVHDDDGFRMQVRDSDTNESSTIMNGVLGSSSEGVGGDTASGTDGNIVITTDAANKKVTFKSLATDMNASPVASGLYVYDIQKTDSQDSERVSTLLYGTFKIIEDVTNS